MKGAELHKIITVTALGVRFSVSCQEYYRPHPPSCPERESSVKSPPSQTLHFFNFSVVPSLPHPQCDTNYGGHSQA